MFSFQDFLKTSHGLVDGNIPARSARKLFRHMEGLGAEPLDLSCSGHGELILLAQLLDAQNGDDILQFFISLQG